MWKTKCEDEGVRAICQYIPINKSVTTLEILDNNVTSLGCEFLGKLLTPKMGTNLTVLKLDHNPFGSPGLNHLAKGIRMNKELVVLSLTYCNIDSKGARSLFEILIYT